MARNCESDKCTVVGAKQLIRFFISQKFSRRRENSMTSKTTKQNATITLERQQKRLGITGFIVFIVLMDMFIPLSTDMYLPAMPTMSEHLAGATDALVKLSVTGFFFSYAIGMLMWGPLSDKFGRKLPLLSGFLLYTLATIGCMVSTHIYMLLVSRFLQGVGAASVTAISMAMIKDCFSGKARERILAIVQTFSGFGPIFAPVIGSWLLLITDWRGIFFVLMLFGFIGTLLTAMYEESLLPTERLQGSAFQSFAQIGTVLKNKSFVWIVIIYSALQVPFYAYLNMSSYIYVNQFGCSEQVYSYYYATCALLSMMGPFLYIRFLENSNKNVLTYVCFSTCVVAGVGMTLIGSLAPIIFCIMMFVFYLISNILRPFSTNLILEQQKNDVGTASSVMNMSYNLFGCAGMLLASIPFSNMVMAIGIMITIFCLVAIIGWWGLLKSGSLIRGFYD